jgi:hypothetical protein
MLLLMMMRFQLCMALLHCLLLLLRWCCYARNTACGLLCLLLLLLWLHLLL